MLLNKISSFRALCRPFIRYNRLFSTDRPFDLDLIATNSDFVLNNVHARGMGQLESSISNIILLKAERSSAINTINEARATRKRLSKDIGEMMKKGKHEEIVGLKAQVEEASAHAAQTEEHLAGLEAKLSSLFTVFPNILDESVPNGKSEEDNVVVSTWGTPKIGTNYKWHDDLAIALNGFDTASAVQISGSRFSVLIGSVAKLERAIIQYFLDFHTKNDYCEVSVPYIVSRSALFGTGQLPKFEEDLFKVNHTVGINKEDSFLIPTGEVPLTNLFREQILSVGQLPLKLVSSTPCFRAEAGSTGRDSKGMLRQHQFHKVELVKICTPETSTEEHEAMTRDVEKVLESLELPHRRVLLCSSDTGFSASKCYDIEVWLPGQQTYREISSCSNCKDFQSRRMFLRFKRAQGLKTEFPHTLNGSGLAVGRTLAAILENYQESDGRVEIPKVLRPYMGGMTHLESNKRLL